MIRWFNKLIRRTIRRGYQGAEAGRLTAHSKPVNRSADSHSMGPWGADSLRAWARKLVQDNAYAAGVVDTIVGSVIGTGIELESCYQDLDGREEFAAQVNEYRQELWEEWCEHCEITGRLNWAQVQQLAFREVVEAGECFLHFVNVPLEFGGVRRRIPLAIEMIEADRLATDFDRPRMDRDGVNRIVRGVELDKFGIAVAYHIYPEDPTDPFVVTRRQPERIPAERIEHIYRMNRIGQTRGVSWFAPIMQWLRDLGVYTDNELQASAVAACFTAVIKTEHGVGGLPSADGADSTDSDGATFENLQPGLVGRLAPGESIEAVNPGRPNSSAGPWLEFILRGIAVGTGLSYETVARDYSKTNYSSNRASQLEDRRRFRTWQCIAKRACQTTWSHFCDAAAMTNNPYMPSAEQLESDFRRAAAVDWHPPTWEWVDPVAEQQSSENSIRALQSTYQAENGKRGANWKRVFRQRAREDRERRILGLTTPEEKKAEAELLKAQADLLKAKSENAAAPGEVPSSPQSSPGAGAGQRSNEPAEELGPSELSELSTMQFKRNRKAIEKILDELEAQEISERRAKVYLRAIGLAESTIAELMDDILQPADPIQPAPPKQEIADGQAPAG